MTETAQELSDSPDSEGAGSGQEELHMSKVRSSGCTLLEEILHIQGKRNPSKTVGAERRLQRADRLKP